MYVNGFTLSVAVPSCYFIVNSKPFSLYYSGHPGELVLDSLKKSDISFE